MAYALPTLADFRMRYPEFDAVPDARVEYWLAHHAPVTESWDEVDYAEAILTLTAHNIAKSPAQGGAVGAVAAMGVTDFKSASMSVSFDAGSVSARAKGGYGSTPYGADFAVYLRRNVGGPRLVGTLSPGWCGC